MDFHYVDSTNTLGGSDGCINYHDEDNTGLLDCLIDHDIISAYNSHCSKVSLADFIVIAAEAVMARTATSYNSADIYADGTLAQQFRDNFKFGRTTSETCDWAIGHLPNPAKGCGDLEAVFINNIYKTESFDNAWTLIAAISGAHTLGSAKIANSGYNGFWSDPETSG